MQWMNEFSEIGSEVQSQQDISLSKVGSHHTEVKASDSMETEKNDSGKKASIYKGVVDAFQANRPLFENFESLEFNIFEVLEKVGRANLFPFMVMESLERL